MIFSDKNLKILDENSISRSKSIISYDETFSKSVIPSNGRYKTIAGELVNIVDGNIFINGSLITTVEVKNLLEFHFIKNLEYTFYFVHNISKNNFCIDASGTEICSFSGKFKFFENFIIFCEKNQIVKLNLITLEKEILKSNKEFENDLKNDFRNDLTNDTCNNDKSDDTCNNDNSINDTFLDDKNFNFQNVVYIDSKLFVDSSNNIHFFDNERFINWHDKLIQKSEIFENSVISVSSGKITKVALNLDTFSVLFTYDGKFVDMLIKNNKIYLLSDLEFKVFDLMTENLIYQDFLLGNIQYQKIKVEKELETKNDLLNLKQSSKVEKFNSIEKIEIIKQKKLTGVNSCSGEILIDIENNTENNFVAALSENGFLFLINPKTGSAISKFNLDFKKNYISGDFLFSLDVKRKSTLIEIYKIYSNKIVRIHKRFLERKIFGKFQLEKIFYVNGKLIFQIDSSMKVFSGLNSFKKTFSAEKISAFDCSGKIIVSSEKGLFDALTGFKIAPLCSVKKIEKSEGILFCLNEELVMLKEKSDKIEELGRISGVIDFYTDSNILVILTKGKFEKVLKYSFNDSGVLDLISENSIEKNISGFIFENFYRNDFGGVSFIKL